MFSNYNNDGSEYKMNEIKLKYYIYLYNNKLSIKT